MKRIDVTHGQLDRVLRSLGFSRPVAPRETPACVYEHKYHLQAVRMALDGYGIADPTTFAAKLQKAG